MDPTPFDIFDLNDAFAVAEPSTARTSASVNDAFAVDEAPTNRASSSPEIAMPQFLLPEVADADGLTPPERRLRETLADLTPINDLRTDGRQSVNPWDPRLTTDLALGVDSTEEVIERYGLSKEEFEALCEVPAFRRELSTTIRELRENGLAYSERCKVQSMMYLERVDNLIHDASTPASTVLDAIKWIGKMAKLEPKEDRGDSGGTGGTVVNLQINFAQ